MKKVSEILDIEKNRDNDLNVIHLFRCGMFYRAYNWSAWLMNSFLCDKNPLSVLCRKYKSTDEEFVFIGFPIKSFDKFIPNHVEVIYIGDNQIDVKVELTFETNDSLRQQHMCDMFNDWKSNFKLPVAKSKCDKHLNKKTSEASINVASIMTQILSYPLEAKTPIENIEFISKLKTQLTALI